MTVIHGTSALPIGTRVEGVSVLVNGVYHRQPFVVLRAVTQVEYFQAVADYGYQDQIYPESPLGPYFYEVQVD